MSDHREWIEQAIRDLEVARHLMTSGYNEWACYAAQQAGEKAVKALRIALGTRWETMLSHKMETIFGTVPDRAPSTDPLLMRAAELDQHNQEARYPTGRAVDTPINGPGQAPMKTYDAAMAADMIAIAAAVVAYVQPLIVAAIQFWQIGRPPSAVATAPASPARRSAKGKGKGKP